MSNQPPSSAEHQDNAPAVPGLLVTLILAGAMLPVGWLVCGEMIDNFGMLGAIGLWALGAVAALAHRRWRRIDQSSAIILCIALALAFCLAEIYWIQKNIVDAETFAKAAKLFPTFLSEYKVEAFAAGIFTVFGMGSFWQRP